MRYWIYLFSVFLTVGAAMAAVPQPAKKPLQTKDVTVKPGESVATFARRNGTSAKTVIALNGLKKPYKIFIGQPLKVPMVKQITKPSEIIPAHKPLRSISQSEEKKQALPKPKSRAHKKFLWPLKGKVISSYGKKQKGLRNDGMNIQAAEGATIKAIENGVIAYAGNELRGFGNLILIKHADRWSSAYGHLGTILVKRGQHVDRGQVIGTVGSSGNVKDPQLHFELRQHAKAVDPKKHLTKMG
ncbi:MAG: peptidoglycan DD-metalloendopeptidase family protein [Alphaproteobacteria bacterium]